ncbi:gamma-glutamyltransferase family protein [Larsenimonas rhizosphaerae]|uniref:gamma-glutamyltransferase family protein n=1 Tax=Larsenimonas rhizosphaerae TaxID=2944682 RepID=UPI002033B5D8|nr:gamma-glutamyltransferase family protein [Larsenimonas rhizosphaerae]MCM2129995.1 gamma-glutamyltransferase family protein [Larsenimonas rhizosphaerae]
MFPFSSQNPYPSERSATYARGGMVAASQPLAAQAGRDMLARGGNAIDAAIATAAALTVVEPTCNGIGSDAFALVWIKDDNGKGTLHGLNASGAAPKALTIDAVKAGGHDTMPMYGWLPVTVPGTPSAWAELSRRFGKLPFADLLTPAITLAREGFPVTPVISQLWEQAHATFTKAFTEPATQGWFETFAPKGRAPRAGEMFKSDAHADTLAELADTSCESFYRGALAERIDAFSRTTGGYLHAEDLAAHQCEWVDPISTRYRGVDVWEIPPNGQGLVALMALNIVGGYDDLHARDDITVLHRQCEAMKLAYTDGHAFIADPAHMTTDTATLLSESYAASRRDTITDTACDPTPGTPPQGGTVYLATADAEGNMVSFIQSNFHGFGSGVVVPNTGIALQNRGQGFSLDSTHVNALSPGKRSFHTIIPGFLTRDGQALGPFGVMGGFMQPQGHMQVVMNLLDFGLDPQAALDAPRWQWMGGKRIAIEAGYPLHLMKELRSRGHKVESAFDRTGFGRGQIILRDPATGVLCGGTEPRTDSAIAVL